MADPVALAEGNFLTTFRTLGAHVAGGAVGEDDDVLHVHSGSGLPSFNPTIVKRLDGDIDALVDAAGAFHADNASPAWCFVVRESDDAGFGSVAERRGFAPVDEMPFMVLDELAPSAPMAGFDVRAVADVAGLRTHFEVASRSFGFPLELVEPLVGPELVGSPFQAFVGEVGGEVVATSLLSCSSTDGTEVAGVYNVATVEAQRGRGLGEAMTAHAIEAARAGGCTAATLQSSAMGHRIYERMGFRTVTHWRVWAPAHQP